MPDEPRDSDQNEQPSSHTPESVAEVLEGQLEPEPVKAEAAAQGEPVADEPAAAETAVGAEADSAGDEAAAPEAPLDPLAELQQALTAERERADQNYELALRTKAEMDNLRKRSANEVDKARKFALEKFATEMLGVKDSLEMGLEAANKDDADLSSIREGTELTLKMLGSALQKFQIEAVDPVGQPFDPELHQAMGMQENPDVAANTVMMVMQKGYTLNGRLIRPAMVMVSKG